MSINLFLLEKKDLTKLDILVLLKDVKYTTVNTIERIFRLSNYQAKKALQELHHEIKVTDYASEFHYVNNMFLCIKTENIDLVLKILINNYYRKSKNVRFIIEWILFNRKMTEIAERVDLSISKIYELKTKFHIFAEEYVKLSKKTYEIFYRRILLTIFVGSPDLLLEYYNDEADLFVQVVLLNIEPLCIVKLDAKKIDEIKITLFIIYFRNKNNQRIPIEIFNPHQFSVKHINVINMLLLLPQSKNIKIEQSDFFFYTVLNL